MYVYICIYDTHIHYTLTCINTPTHAHTWLNASSSSSRSRVWSAFLSIFLNSSKICARAKKCVNLYVCKRSWFCTHICMYILADICMLVWAHFMIQDIKTRFTVLSTATGGDGNWTGAVQLRRQKHNQCMHLTISNICHKSQPRYSHTTTWSCSLVTSNKHTSQKKSETIP